MKKTLRMLTAFVFAVMLISVLLPMGASNAENRSVSISLSYKVNYITKATTTASLQCTIGEKPIVYYWFDWKSDLNCWRLGSRIDGGSEVSDYYNVPVGYDCYEYNMASCSGYVTSYTTVSSGAFSFSMSVPMEGNSDVSSRNLSVKYVNIDDSNKQVGTYTHTIKQYGVFAFSDKTDFVIANVPTGFSLVADQEPIEVKSNQSTLAPNSITIQVETASYMVTFVDWDDTVLKEESVKQGKDATPPEVTTVREGLAFYGWDTDYTNVQSDLTVKAVYADACTVTFVNWDDSVLKEEVVAKGRDATPPENPVREGYFFTGWDKEYTNIQEDVTIKAVFGDSMVVNFVDHDGTVLATHNVAAGESVTAPENPTRYGYIFLGWDAPYTDIQASIDIHAIYIGDVTLDEKFNTGDAVKILRVCSGLDAFTDPIQDVCADYTGDTRVNTGDAVRVLRIVSFGYTEETGVTIY